MTFIKVPTIYIGERVGLSSNGSCVALTPGLANFQPVNGNLYFPRQFGPKNAMGDIFERTTFTRVPTARFSDDWTLYHALEGEVHCGTNVKRVLPAFNWWAP
jgi:protein-arginine deiminase